MATRRAATKTVATTENTTKETAPVKTTKKFEQNELIECRSLVQGTLFMPGKQSDILYRWDGYGDVREVEYRDLYSLKSSRSPYIYDPCFQIENDELLEDPRWKDVKDLYDNLMMLLILISFLLSHQLSLRKHLLKFLRDLKQQLKLR